MGRYGALWNPMGPTRGGGSTLIAIPCHEINIVHRCGLGLPTNRAIQGRVARYALPLPGVSNVKDLFNYPDIGMQTILDASSLHWVGLEHACDVLRSNLEEGVLITSAFSGMGTGETAAEYAIQVAAAGLGGG